MKVKKVLALLLASVMTLSIMACGSKSEDAAAENEAEVSEETVEEDSTEETAEEIVLSYWAQWSENETQAEVLKEAIARFNEDYPNVTVEVNWAGREVRDILRSSIDSGSQIDIVEGSHDNLTVSLGEEYLLDMTSYIAGTDFEASISGGMVAFAKSFSSDGESWYYVPAQPFVGTLFYNKAIFAEAGVETMPTTWDEFLDCCQKIKDAGYDPITVDDAYQQSMYGHYLAMMKGVDWVGELLTDKSGELWSDPAVLQMAEDFAELRELGYLAETVGSNVYRTIWEGFQNIESHCHAWNCYPARMMQEFLLGIRPLEPGFSKILIKPYIPEDMTFLQKVKFRQYRA